MKKSANNKYQGTKFNAFRSSGETVIKHPGTHPFKKGNDIEEMPAYNTQGKEYKRILPKARNEKIITVPILCELINKIVPGNLAEYTGSGLKLNGIEISVTEGIATVKKLKFRFKDLYELLDQLVQENILIAKKAELYLIKSRYYHKLSEGSEL